MPRTWLLGRWGREKVEHDRAGYRLVDLGETSRFRDVDPRKLRIGVADPREMYRHHSQGHHEYLLPQSVLDSDAIISIPKLKTHRRAGVTLTLKGFFGLVAAKESLPHYTVGLPRKAETSTFILRCENAFTAGSTIWFNRSRWCR